MDVKKVWPDLVFKAWQDVDFKKKLLENPKKCLQEAGIEVPKECNISVLENSEKTIHLILPAKPWGHLSEEQLQEMAAGHLDFYRDRL